MTNGESTIAFRAKAAPRGSRLSRLAGILFGYDYFIAYAHKDGLPYASGLYERLSKGFAVFFDEREFNVGDHVPREDTAAIKKTKCLIFVGSPAAMESKWVRYELETFWKKSRRIIPINFGGRLTQVDEGGSGQQLLGFRFSDILWIAEPSGGWRREPSAETVQKIREAFHGMREQRRRVVMVATVLWLLATLTSGTIALWALWDRQRQITHTQRISEAQAQVFFGRDLIERGNRFEAVQRFFRAYELAIRDEKKRRSARNMIGAHEIFGPAIHHKDEVNSVQFSPDGELVLTASDDRTAQVWSAQTSRPVGLPLRHDEAVSSAQFSPNGEKVLTASSDGTACIWNAQTGILVHGPFTHGDALLSAEFSTDGSKIVTGSLDGTAWVWDIQKSEPIAQPMRHMKEVTSARFNQEGTLIVTASTDGSARLWNGATSEQIGRPLQHPDRVLFAQFSPDGSRVVTTSSDGKARLWDVTTHDLIGNPLAHKASVWSAFFSPDGRYIATASSDGWVSLWDAHSGQKVDPKPSNLLTPWLAPNNSAFKHEDTVWEARFSPNGHQIVSASSDGAARIWLVESRRLYAAPLRHKESDIRYAGTLFGLHGNIREIKLRYRHTIKSARFSSDGRSVVTANGNSTAQVWRIPSFHLVDESSSNEKPINAESPDLNELARQWEDRHGSSLFGPSAHREGLTAAQFNRDKSLFVTASLDGTARIWDAINGQPLEEPLRHEGPVNSVQFSPDGSMVVTASLDGTARIYDAFSAQPLGELLRHPEAVEHAQFGPDGRTVITRTRGGNVRIWDVPAPAWDDLEWLRVSLEYRTELRYDEDSKLFRALSIVELEKLWEWLDDYSDGKIDRKGIDGNGELCDAPTWEQIDRWVKEKRLGWENMK